MDQRRIRETDRFEVRDSSGKRHTIVRYQHSIVSRTMGTPAEETDTLGEYRTADGTAVNYDESTKTFTILDPFGEIAARR